MLANIAHAAALEDESRHLETVKLPRSPSSQTKQWVRGSAVADCRVTVRVSSAAQHTRESSSRSKQRSSSSRRLNASTLSAISYRKAERRAQTHRASSSKIAISPEKDRTGTKRSIIPTISDRVFGSRDRRSLLAGRWAGCSGCNPV